MKRLFLNAGLAVALGAGSAQATEVKVGIDRSSNCLPFSCVDSNNLLAQQQLYTSSSFTGPTSIGSVSFYKAANSPVNAILSSMTFNLSFYLTNATLATLGSNLAANRGTLLADFGSFTISGLQPDVLTFASSTAFTYNPSAGNLLLELTVLSGGTEGTAFFRSDSRPDRNAPAETIRRVISSTDGNFVGGNALVTNFSSTTAAVAAVPEPATWAMMVIGFGVVGGAMRRRRQAVKVTYA